MPSRSSSWKVWEFNARKRWRKKKMPQVKISQEVKTGSWRIRSTVNREKNMDGIKQSVKRWTNWHKKITLARLRGPNSCGIHQIGASSSTVQEEMPRWPLDLIIVLQMHWKIISTENLKNIKNQSHHKFKTECETTWSSQNHAAKELK